MEDLLNLLKEINDLNTPHINSKVVNNRILYKYDILTNEYGKHIKEQISR